MADLVLTADVSSIRDAEKALKRFSDASEKLGRSVLNTASKVKSVSSGWDQANKLYKQGVLNSKALAAAQTELARELATLNGYTKSNGALNTQRALAELRAAQAARESARATEEAARAAQNAANRQRELRMRYQEGYAAFARARNEMRGLREAMRAGIITTDQYRERVRLLREELQRQGQQNQGNIRSQNNLGVAIQQTGYQVGDFFVQVQSGTNFMVAFGQQATQLVGILPLIHTQLGLTAMAAIGLSTGLGIIIPIVTAVGAGFMRASGNSKTLEDNFSSLDEASSVLHETFNRLADTDLDKTFGSLSDFIYSSSQAMRELAAQQELDRLVTTLEKLKSQAKAGFLDNLVQGFVSIGTLGMNIKTPEMLDEEKFRELGLNMSRSTFEGFVNGLRYHAQRGDRTSVVSMFQDMMSEIVKGGTKLPTETFDMLVQLEKAMLAVAESQAHINGEISGSSKKARDDMNSHIETYQDFLKLLSEEKRVLEEQISLYEVQLSFGLESKNSKRLEAQFARDAYQQELLQAGIRGQHLADLMAMYDEMVLLKQETESVRDRTEEFAEIMRTADLSHLVDQSKTLADNMLTAADAAAAALAARSLDVANAKNIQYAGRGTTSSRPAFQMDEQGRITTVRSILAEQDRARSAASRGGADKEDRIGALAQSLATEKELLTQWYEDSLVQISEFNTKELELLGGQNEAKLRLEQEYQSRLAEIQKQQYQGVSDAQQGAMSAFQSFMGTLSGMSEGAAKAVLVVNTALSISQAIQNTAVAATRALAELGPVAGPAAAAKIKAFGAAQVGLIAANAALKLGSRGGGSGGGSGGGGGRIATPATAAATPQRVLIQGIGPNDLITGSQLSEIFDRLYEENENRGLVFQIAS